MAGTVKRAYYCVKIWRAGIDMATDIMLVTAAEIP